jgi:hypothetical protein
MYRGIVHPPWRRCYHRRRSLDALVRRRVLPERELDADVASGQRGTSLEYDCRKEDIMAKGNNSRKKETKKPKKDAKK